MRELDDKFERLKRFHERLGRWDWVWLWAALGAALLLSAAVTMTLAKFGEPQACWLWSDVLGTGICD